jgi:hypothetical protein
LRESGFPRLKSKNGAHELWLTDIRSGVKAQTVKKDDDQYEMAIRFKKDEDFSGWYTDVILLTAFSRQETR